MINPYKRLDVYRCRIQSHGRFEGKVSVYHVLHEKGCIPDGCIYFRWRCSLLDKGGTCKKGYRNPGKNCGGCRYFSDEKVHKIPVRILEGSGYDEFLRQMEEFDEWLKDNLGRRVLFYGRINQVGPWLKKEVFHDSSRVSMKGYLAAFTESYLDRTHFEDSVYLRFSKGFQLDYNFTRGDLIECEAEVSLDGGRLVMVRPRRVEIVERAEDRGLERQPPEEDHARNIVSSRTATALEDQSEKCMRCERGRLVDVVYHTKVRGKPKINRELYCLEGVQNPEDCCYRVLKEVGIQRSYNYGDDPDE